MNTEDLNEIERAGRRCSVCHSGRGWRRLEVIRPADREPVVLCPSCRARVGEDLLAARERAPTHDPSPAPVEAPPESSPTKRRSEKRPDRLQAALREMPDPFSTGMAARAAGLNKDKTLARLQDLERRGELRRDGNRWSTKPAPTDLSAAMDRLEARTSNLRIVKERVRAG